MNIHKYLQQMIADRSKVMPSQVPKFYAHPQSNALSAFLPLLKPHLPISNPLYVRLQAPHNTPSRHCLFAATFPPQTSDKTIEVPEVYTILFADRSRHSESQIWLFNPLTGMSNIYFSVLVGSEVLFNRIEHLSLFKTFP